MKDLRGNDIKIGSMVAYNRSGDVVLGQVELFARRQQTLSWRSTIMIPAFTIIRNVADKKLSKVKRPESMMVLPGRAENYEARNYV